MARHDENIPVITSHYQSLLVSQSDSQSGSLQVGLSANPSVGQSFA